MRPHLLFPLACVLLITSCSTFSRHEEEPATPQETEAQKMERLEAQNRDLKTVITTLSSKIDTLQTQLTSVNEKLEVNRTRVDNLMSNQKPKPAGVQSLPTEGTVKLPPVGYSSAEASFAADEAVRKYRQSMILFESHNYPESVLSFSKFVDQYPDHALAGSAQYYLGESYFKQGEYKLAIKEFERVITSYDRSPHIADTLRDLSDAESRTGQKEAAEQHRQLLSSLFPNSPAAARESAAPAQEAVGETPPEKTETIHMETAPSVHSLDAPPPAETSTAPTETAPQ